MRLPCPLLAFFFFCPHLFVIKAVVFINETETCVITNAEAANNLEKSQFSSLITLLMTESCQQC